MKNAKNINEEKTKYLLPQSGYTLIEILVALTIVGLIFGIGYVNFRDFSRRQALAGIARKIKGDLRLAQESAAAGKKPTDALNKCVDPTEVTRPRLDGYNFQILDAHTYVIQAACSGGFVEIKRVQITNDITMSNPTPNPVLFKVLGQGTNIGDSPALINLTQAGTSNAMTVTVSSGGEIK